MIGAKAPSINVYFFFLLFLGADLPRDFAATFLDLAMRQLRSVAPSTQPLLYEIRK
jgi:hypothetical protein